MRRFTALASILAATRKSGWPGAWPDLKIYQRAVS